MKAQELMTREVFSVADSQTLNDAAQLMWEHDCGCVPVVSGSDETVVGVVTDRDIAMAAYIKGRGLADIPVHDVHSGRAIVAKPEDDIGSVERCMKENQIRRVPIVNEAQELVGMLSLRDIALATSSKGSGITEKEVASTLSAICEKKPGQHLEPAVAA